MYWVHFMREFYKPAMSPHAPAQAATHTPVSTITAAHSHHTLHPQLDEAPMRAASVISATDGWTMDALMHTPQQLTDAFVQNPSAEDALTMEQVQDDIMLLAQRLQTMQTALAVSDRGRSAFLSSMSHELRTPLNAIMGFADMMKSGVFGEIDNPTYKQYVTHIHDSGAHLLSKINDLLDIASMDADNLTLQEEECVLEEILTELVEIHSHRAFERQQTIQLDAAKGITVMADRAKLLCALSHFVTNALRHSAEGAHILVRARIQPDDGLILSVHDEGEGIGNGQLAIIREALQADVAYERIECGGIGLGLSLSKELAARHGGRMMIDSMRRRGTVVAMILPIERIVHGMPRRRRTFEPHPQPIQTNESRLV